MVTENYIKTTEKFFCEKCDFKCCKKGDWTRHITTRKHIKGVNGDVLVTIDDILLNHTCDKCSKTYHSRNGLWTHKKKCLANNILEKKEENNEIIVKDNQIEKLTNLVLEVLKQNQELTKQIIETSKPNYITNNNCTTNNKFNLNIFLNEKCKDAINMSDFIESLQLSLTDLEKVGTQGFIQGISNIFVNGLKALDVCKRPLHCSDFKREILYIKDENKWEKEDEDKQHITKAIKQVAHKNIKQIPIWVKENPNCKDSQSIKNDEYLHLISNSMGAGSHQEDEYNMKGIIKNIAKEVIIEK